MSFKPAKLPTKWSRALNDAVSAV